MLPRQPLRFVLADDPGAGLRRAPNDLRPPRGDGCHLVGDKPSGQAGARVWLREVRLPAIVDAGGHPAGGLGGQNDPTSLSAALQLS
jgi:hypothetical protein